MEAARHRAGLPARAAGPVRAGRGAIPHAALQLGPAGGLLPGGAVLGAGAHRQARPGRHPEQSDTGRFCGVRPRAPGDSGVSGE